MATDFSETSEPAMGVAVGLARAAGATLHVVHAWQPTTLVAMDLGLVSTPETVTRITSERQGAMHNLLARYATPGFAMHGHILEGEVAPEVARFARQQGASLIVMGTSAPTGLRAVLLGSTADQIIRVAPCPVLIVRAGPPTEEV